MPSVSVVIVARNEAHQLARCIESVRPLADEILVGDSGSDDGTPELARSLGATVHLLEWKGFAATKNELNSYAKCDYILSLDADEVLDEAMRQALLRLKPELTGAYEVERLAFIGATPIRHGGWRPDRKLRLFPRSQARWEGEYVHETLRLDTGLTVRRLPGLLRHYSFADLHDLVERGNRYSTLAAEGMLARGRSVPFWKLWLTPPWRFFESYVLKGGFRDGFYGLVVAATHALSGWLKYAKAEEKRRQKP